VPHSSTSKVNTILCSETSVNYWASWIHVPKIWPFVVTNDHHTNGNYYLHMYLEFKNVTTCVAVRDVYSSFFEGTINVQACRSTRSWLKCISKEDDEPYFNCSLSKLSFRYQLMFWARNTTEFRHSDPYVVEHWNRYKCMESVFEDVKRSESVKVNCYIQIVF
jgi:hypothetical protein